MFFISVSDSPRRERPELQDFKEGVPADKASAVFVRVQTQSPHQMGDPLKPKPTQHKICFSDVPMSHAKSVTFKEWLQMRKEGYTYQDIFWKYPLLTGLVPDKDEEISRDEIQKILQELPSLEGRIKELQIQSNNLEELDLTGLSKLEKLVLICPRLTKLNKGEAPIQIQYLQIKSENLEELDLIGLSKLETLGLNCPRLTKLNLSRCDSLGVVFSEIATIEAIGTAGTVFDMDFSFPQLQQLSFKGCRSFRFYGLDLTLCPNLNELDMSDTEICDRDMRSLKLNYDAQASLKLNLSNTKIVKYFDVSTVSRTVRAAELDISGTPVKELSILGVYSKLNVSRCPHLKSVTLYYCDGLRHLDASRCPNLETVSLFSPHHPLRKIKSEARRTVNPYTLFLKVKKDDGTLEVRRDPTTLSKKELEERLEHFSYNPAWTHVVPFPVPNRLQFLNLENCSRLTQIDGLTFAMGLKEINLSGTALRSVYIPHCRNIENIDLSYCDDLVEVQLGCAFVLSVEGKKYRSQTESMTQVLDAFEATDTPAPDCLVSFGKSAILNFQHSPVTHIFMGYPTKPLVEDMQLRFIGLQQSSLVAYTTSGDGTVTPARLCGFIKGLEESHQDYHKETIHAITKGPEPIPLISDDDQASAPVRLAPSRMPAPLVAPTDPKRDRDDEKPVTKAVKPESGSLRKLRAAAPKFVSTAPTNPKARMDKKED